jgi:phosphate starvation-inducible PhoH-like protein
MAKKKKATTENKVVEKKSQGSQEDITKKQENFHKHLFKFYDNFSLRNDKQIQLITAIKENDIIFVSGPAGVGKTIVAMKGALELYRDNKVDQILITKPIVEASESLGFLPGDVDSKIDPYMHSFYSNVKKIIPESDLKKLMLAQDPILKAVPLAYMRGSTFTKSCAILDEAQNTTIIGLKLFLSRIGDESKLIIMGDVDQTDLKLRSGDKSGLEDAFTRFKGVKGVAFVEFTEEDIVRHTILIDLMKRYKTK